MRSFFAVVVATRRAQSRVVAALVLACAIAAGGTDVADAAGFVLTDELGAVASGEGAPRALFGWDVGIEGDLAVACDARQDGTQSRIRTYARDGERWRRLANQDIDIPGDSGCRLSLNGGVLLVSAYRSTAPSTGYVRLYRRNGDEWTLEYDASGTAYYFDAVATGENFAVVGEPFFTGGAGDDQGRIWILRHRQDGTWSEERKIADAPQANAEFGTSVAIVSGAIAVGAPGMSVSVNGTPHAKAGTAYVYELTVDTWNLAATLTEPSAAIGNNHRFGAAVAISGADVGTPDRLLVSSPSDQASGRAGIVRGYRRGAGTWLPGLTVSVAVPSSTDQFGCAVAMDGDWAAIGACASGAAESRRGAVQIAHFDADFSSVQSLTERVDAQGADNDFLGSRIGIDRDGPSVIVGNLAADLYNNDQQGVVLIGRSQSGEAPTLRRELDLGQGLTQASAGAVAVDGDTVVVGAYGEATGSQLFRGAVYVYRRTPGGYVFEARIVAPDGLAGDSFGFSVAVHGDVILVGAIGRDIAGVASAGGVYAFHRAGTTWSLEDVLEPVAPEESTSLGLSLAFDGSTALIGERREHVTVYQRSAAGVWTVAQDLDRSGQESVAISGDRAALANPGAEVAGSYVGEVSVYARSGGLWQLDEVLNGATDGQEFGDEVALAGNLLAAVSNAYRTPALLYRRGSNGWLPEASLLPDDASPTLKCHHVAVSAVAVALGCWDQPAAVVASAVYVFEKSGGAWHQVQKLELPDPKPSDAFGYSVAWGGDGTLFGGALSRTLDFAGQGAVYVYAGECLFRDGFD